MTDELTNCIKVTNGKRLSLHKSRFYQPVDKGSIKRPVDVHEDWLSFIVLGLIAFLAFLILNPFLSLFILSLFSLFVRGSSKLSLLILTFAFALFYASRNIGVSWPGGIDDVPVYVQRYQNELHDSLASIVSRYFLEQTHDNEVLYYSYTWVIGKLFNPGPETFIFIVYFVQLTLLSVVAYLVSRRYAVIFILIFFFGMGDPNPQILHLWRANHAILVFLIGILMYFRGNQKTGQIIIFASLGFHTSLILFIIIFELYIFLRRMSGFFLTLVLGALIFYLIGNFLEIAMQNIFPAKAILFFKDTVEVRNFTFLCVLIVLLAANYYYKLSMVTRFVTFGYLAYYIFNILLLHSSSYMTRLAQLAIPMVAIPLFEIIMKQPKVLIPLVIILLILRAMLNPGFEMYTIMIPEYRDPFYGVLNILFFK